ncbi:hypothetical protein ACSRUE_19970 [Sorangium sp. KYC3313]|uniref:hypothetical protein n=1 Tax=Sorangium sp. KYC3313 TaxID=3449740 RepID=UPI003F8C40CF
MRNRRRFVSDWDELDYLYHKALQWFYGSPVNSVRARAFAVRLEELLTKMKPGSMSIMAQECWALVCEIKGDLVGAIRHRRREIKLLMKLLSLPEYPQLDPEIVGSHSDLVDLLVLLALLYQDTGSFEEAIKCLEQAREVAKQRRFRFPAYELLTDLRLTVRESKRSRVGVMSKTRRTGYG